MALADLTLSTTMSELSYVEQFVAASKPFKPVIEDNFEGNHGRVFVLAEMPAVLSPEAAAAALGEPEPLDATHTVKVIIKSIRAPKFVVEYEVPINDSVFAVKERLVSDPKGPLNESGMTVAAVKLLLKARAVSDTRQLRELPSTEFTAMFMPEKQSDHEIPPATAVYWGDYETLRAPEAHHNLEKREKPGLTDKFWEELEALTARYADEPRPIVARFREALSEPEVPDLD